MGEHGHILEHEEIMKAGQLLAKGSKGACRFRQVNQWWDS